jgi:hypothetical protein
MAAGEGPAKEPKRRLKMKEMVGEFKKGRNLGNGFFIS